MTDTHENPLLRSFDSAVGHLQLPDTFPNPETEPVAAVAIRAASQLMTELKTQPWYQALLLPTGGKMFGVLVVTTGNHTGYLAAFSGMLDGSWMQPGFVPPVFDVITYAAAQNSRDTNLAELTTDIQQLENSTERARLIENISQIETLASEQLADVRSDLRKRKACRQEQRRLGITDSTILNRQSQNDKKAWKQLKQAWHEKLSLAQEELLQVNNELARRRQARASYSFSQQSRVFSLYQLRNVSNVTTPVTAFFQPGLPPGGTGDCAAPKLLQYAHQQSLQSIALAEFWVGQAPKDSVRRHGQFYPPCRSKCQVILPYMLDGLVEKLETQPSLCRQSIQTLFEDEWLILIQKPDGLLSTPGKTLTDSVYTRLQSNYPDATGPLLVHRLDMDTSGIMLIAKDKRSHKALQRQFLQRSIHKTYVALIEQVPTRKTGTISLPLRVDLEDRPRQLVCYQHGKPTVTHYQVIDSDNGSVRIQFTPVTGRTHQLRVHAAHTAGLNSPIVGDRLYGNTASRLMLHAESLSFIHPATGTELTYTAAAPF